MFSASKTAAPSTGYNLQKSLRFRSSASAYLNRTPASNGNLTTWTWSAWVKRGAISNGNNQVLMGSNTVGEERIGFNSDDTFIYYNWNGSYSNEQITTQVFRDPSAWYHIIVVRDTTNATASNRIRIYVNGQQVTSFSTNITPSQNASSYDFNTTASHQIGRWPTGIQYFDGYLAEVNFIDGQALTPSSFGSFNSVTGVWQPAKYTGTYGTNGFYLPFTNTSSTTTLGYDLSGNGNNWTTNNISLTTGSTYDSMTDVPTLTSATVANYCVMNPTVPQTNNTQSFTNGNLQISCSSAGNQSGSAIGSMGMSSGKWYWENTYISNSNSPSSDFAAGFGITNAIVQTGYNNNSTGNQYYLFGNGVLQTLGSQISSWTSGFTVGDVIGIAFDATNGTLAFYKNGTLLNTYSSVTTGLTYWPWYCQNTNGSVAVACGFNFGQQGFKYTPPTGFVALNTYNLPTSTIVKGNTVMDATTYTGNGTAGTNIVNTAGFQPDLVWIKTRSVNYSHGLYDSIRGVTETLRSDSTNAETVYSSSSMTAFNSNGFQVGTYGDVNASGQTLVGWQWQAGKGTTSSNTNGSITSTVSVNPTAGFSVVTYTGTGSAGTVGHGLGVAPSMIIVKNRSQALSWDVYHKSLGNGGGVFLNTTGAYYATSAMWNNTSPTSSVFTIGNGNDVNQSGTNLVAYCWAAVSGFSAFGSYTANGSADGPFIYCGFRPRWILFKRSTSATNWYIVDTAIESYNAGTTGLYPNTSSAESTEGALDILSNGFKPRSSDGAFNYPSGETFIYAAFAENPFKNALAR